MSKVGKWRALAGEVYDAEAGVGQATDEVARLLGCGCEVCNHDAARFRDEAHAAAEALSRDAKRLRKAAKALEAALRG